MSDSSWLLSSEPDSIDDAELPSGDIAVDEPVEPSSDSDYFGAAFDQEATPAPASDEWNRMRATAEGQQFGHDVNNRNAYHSPIGMLNNGIIYQVGMANIPGRKAGSTPIDQEWLTKNKRVHVRSSRYRDALELLVKRHIIMLACEKHTGKQCAALNLLAGRNLDELRSIDPNIDLADDQSFTFTQRCGYLIDGLSPASFEKLTAYTLDRLANELKTQDSYLAVTLNVPALLSQSVLNDYAILWDTLPDRDLMLQQHLAWYLKDETLRPSALQRCEEMVVKRVLSGLAPMAIDTLAKLLADVELGKLETTEEALRKFVADPITRIADWFQMFTSLEECTFLIALAVLSGARYQSISAAAVALHAEITNAPEQSPLSSTAAFDRTRINLLREINAHIILSEEDARFGRVLAERVELDKHEYRAALLDYIWREYDGLRKPLLNWLRKLGLNNVPGVRELAAGAVAKFAQYDLSEVRWAVLQHWAKHADNRVRRAAALAIALLASEPQFCPYALDLLENWSLLRNNRRLCWTAAAAYGGLLDAQLWDVALYGLGNIAEAGDAHLLHVINRGVANLFQAAQGQLLASANILDTLETWTLSTKKSVSIGLLIFLNLAQLATPEDPPVLLQLSASPECGVQIRTLWRHAFNHPAARPKAVIALRSWLDAADTDPTLCPAVQQLITDLVVSGDQREQQRLNYWLDRWARDPKQPCSSVAIIRSNISSTTQAKEAHA